MIILDYNQIALSNIITQKLGAQEDLIRHMILNSIRMYNVKFGKEYGQVVIASDGKMSWRRNYFPNYKASRRKNREDSDVDWNEIFRILGKIREELETYSPYKVLCFDGCEADDVIGTLVGNTQEFGNHENVMIVSSDKDFVQLHRYGNVKQWSPMQKKWVKEKDPSAYFIEHVFRGDTGDGVPNVLSGDNVFVDGVRQTPLSKKKLEDMIAHKEDLKTFLSEDIYRNYQRNKKLIDLTETPEELKQQIINKYENYKIPHRSRLLNYLVKNRCKLLIECVEEFF